MPTVWATYPVNRKTEAIAAVRRGSAVHARGRPAATNTRASVRLLTRNRGKRNESGSTCSSTRLVAGKVAAQMTVVSTRASCGMGSAPQHGGHDEAGQPRQHSKVDSDADVLLPGGLPFLGIQRGVLQVPAFCIEPQCLPDGNEQLLRHDVTGARRRGQWRRCSSLLLHD